MKSRIAIGWLLALGLMFGLGFSTQAQDKKDEKKEIKKQEKKAVQKNDPAKPFKREGEFADKLHESFLKRAKEGNVDVLFLGDSITQGWAGAGKAAWKDHFEPLKAANFGIGGDRTEHVLWRITEGKELEGISPKVCVLMIGTNNTGSNSAEEIAAGVKAIVEELNKQKPDMKVILLAVFPRSGKKIDKGVTKIEAKDLQPKIDQINAIISKLDDGKKVFFVNINAKFLESDGGMSREVMPDWLHLSPKGYTIWAEAIKEKVTSLLK